MRPKPATRWVRSTARREKPKSPKPAYISAAGWRARKRARWRGSSVFSARPCRLARGPVSGSGSPAVPSQSSETRPSARIFLVRSEEHTSELQSLMRILYDVFCLKKNKYQINNTIYQREHNAHTHTHIIVHQRHL